jgi:hypothetical protein
MSVSPNVRAVWLPAGSRRHGSQSLATAFVAIDRRVGDNNLRQPETVGSLNLPRFLLRYEYRTGRRCRTQCLDLERPSTDGDAIEQVHGLPANHVTLHSRRPRISSRAVATQTHSKGLNISANLKQCVEDVESLYRPSLAIAAGKNEAVDVAQVICLNSHLPVLSRAIGAQHDHRKFDGIHPSQYGRMGTMRRVFDRSQPPLRSERALVLISLVVEVGQPAPPTLREFATRGCDEQGVCEQAAAKVFDAVVAIDVRLWVCRQPRLDQAEILVEGKSTALVRALGEIGAKSANDRRKITRVPHRKVLGQRVKFRFHRTMVHHVVNIRSTNFRFHYFPVAGAVGPDMTWPFTDPPNLGVFVARDVFEGQVRLTPSHTTATEIGSSSSVSWTTRPTSTTTKTTLMHGYLHTSQPWWNAGLSSAQSPTCEGAGPRIA